MHGECVSELTCMSCFQPWVPRKVLRWVSGGRWFVVEKE